MRLITQTSMWAPGRLNWAGYLRENSREAKAVGDPRKFRLPEWQREPLGELRRRDPLPHHHGYLNISANIVGSSLKPGPPA